VQTVGKFSIVAFLLGIVFSGFLVIAFRGVDFSGRKFSKLSLRLVSELGAAAGFLYWLFLASTGGRTGWSPRLAVLNFVLLIVIGSAAAAVTLLIARRAG